MGVRGERPENLGYIGAAEPLQTVWIALRANERAILEDVTLEHIVSGELPAERGPPGRRPPRLGLSPPTRAPKQRSQTSCCHNVL